jgi:hypothetical protein
MSTSDKEPSGGDAKVAHADRPAPDEATPPGGTEHATLAERHFRIGWWGVFVFACLGLVLESMQGLRVGWYLDVSNDARRLMFRLAHAHGTLFSIVNVLFALSLRSELGRTIASIRFISACFLTAIILVPVGFFAGGLVIYDGDPGLGVMLVPVGALVFILGAARLARAP